MADNLTLGRGRLFFNPFLAGTKTKTGELEIASTSSCEVTISKNDLVHKSMAQAQVVEDANVTIDTSRSGAFTTEQISIDNMAMFYVGEAVNRTVAGGAVAAEAHNAVQQGRYYQLGTTITGARKVSAVVVKDSVPTTYTLNTDYTVDADLGRIYIVPGGGIADDTNLLIDYTEAAYTIDEITTDESKSIEGELRFISDNAGPGSPQKDFLFPYATLTPNGSQTFIADEWQTLGFDFKVLKRDATTEAIYVNGRAVV